MPDLNLRQEMDGFWERHQAVLVQDEFPQLWAPGRQGQPGPQGGDRQGEGVKKTPSPRGGRQAGSEELVGVSILFLKDFSEPRDHVMDPVTLQKREAILPSNHVWPCP